MTSVASLLVIAAGAALMRWNDLFHLVVGLPIIVGAAFLGWRLTRAGGMEEDDPVSDPDDEPAVVRLVRGAIVGALLLGVTAGGVSVAARTPLYGWFYDRDLETLNDHIEVLERAGAYDEVVRLLDERKTERMSSAAQGRLAELRIRALIQSAEHRQGEERISGLRVALAEASQTHNVDLRELLEAKLRAFEKENLLAQVRLAVDQSDRGLVMKVPDVLFQSGSDRLIDSAQAQIRQVADLLNAPANSVRRVSVEGHADDTGTAGANERLSDGRARSVAAALIGERVDAGRITPRGLGSGQPIASNDTAEGRAKNRRVEIVLLNDSAK